MAPISRKLMFATFGTILVITACAVDNGFMAATSGMVAGSGGASGQVTGSGGYVGPVKTFALTPPMGWNSWNKFQGGVSDAVIGPEIADAMVTSGMKAAGYQYVVIDDTWQMTRDASGNIVPDPARFPDMKALADYVHGQGLKFGLYSDRGSKTCAGRPGSQDHETQDAQTYAAWGVDYLKYDNCNADAATLQQGYQKMGNALTATGRDIVYSICAWWYYDWAVQVGHLQRTTTDIQDNWLSVMALLNRNGGDTTRYGSCTACPAAKPGECIVCNQDLPEAAYSPSIAGAAGPGHWNDPDMLEVGNGGMTNDEYRAHFSMWAMMAAPLIAGNDLRNMTPATASILTNADVIAVDQDPQGVQGKPISTDKVLEVWSKRLAGTATYAVALLNRSELTADITVTWSSLGITSGGAMVRDLWAGTDLGSIPSQYTAKAVPGHGVVMLKVVGE